MNNKRISAFVLSAFLALGIASAARAESDYITLEAGDFNVLRKNEHALWYGAQYRSPYFWDKFLVDTGVGGNADGGIYAYLGAQYDWNLIGNVYMLPGFGVGYWHEGGSKNLGGPLEFKSSIETDYRFDSGVRAGAALWHISNAGIYSHNAGTEVIEATFSVPLATILGGR